MGYQTRVNTRYKQVGSSTYLDLPGIITESGLIVSHLKYLAHCNSRSLSWKKKSVTSLILLLRYMDVYQDKFSSPVKLLKAFSHVLSEGTIDYESLEDPSGLYWKPKKPQNSADIINHINQYTDYLARESGFNENLANPFREATAAEERLNWCAYYNRKKEVFLSHLMSSEKSKERNRKVRMVTAPQTPSVQSTNTKRFPEQYIEELLTKGFKTSIGKPDYKSMAMTMLMHYGGLRASELFHIYIGDIIEDLNAPEEALVRVYHPDYGTSPKTEFKTRKDYLGSEFNLKPRNQIIGKLHSGWKSPLLNDKNFFFDVYFSSSEQSKIFYKIWINYLIYQRVDPKKGEEHPYAFTNSFGEPETIANFTSKHRRAIERINLKPDKNLGTTPHGHRHAYGFQLDELGLSQVEIQKCMHHKNPNSCLIYLEPSEQEVRQKINAKENHSRIK